MTRTEDRGSLCVEMGISNASAVRRDSLPPGVTRVGGAPEYVVATWRNVMIQHVSGEVDLGFLKASLAGHHAALQHTPTGYGVITLVEPSARIPGSDVRDEAGRLRMKTQHMLRAHTVLIGSEGFFASTMRAVITGIVTVAQSRVPMKMAGNELEAASFIVDRVCAIGTDPRELAETLASIRAAN